MEKIENFKLAFIKILNFASKLSSLVTRQKWLGSQSVVAKSADKIQRGDSARCVSKPYGQGRRSSCQSELVLLWRRWDWV